MSGNRVEELEARVRELQATIDGLTDELMETKDRLRAIEEEVDPDLDMGIIEGRPARKPATQTNDDAPPVSQEDVEEAVEKVAEDEETDSADDIIVA
jgi:hypothetical protein